MVVLEPEQLSWVRLSVAAWRPNRVRRLALCLHSVCRSLRPLRIAASSIRIVHRAGALEYKIVVLRPCGYVRWEDGRPNRCLDTIQLEAQSLKRGDEAQARTLEPRLHRSGVGLRRRVAHRKGHAAWRALRQTVSGLGPNHRRHMMAEKRSASDILRRADCMSNRSGADTPRSVGCKQRAMCATSLVRSMLIGSSLTH